MHPFHIYLSAAVSWVQQCTATVVFVRKKTGSVLNTQLGQDAVQTHPQKLILYPRLFILSLVNRKRCVSYSCSLVTFAVDCGKSSRATAAHAASSPVCHSANFAPTAGKLHGFWCQAPLNLGWPIESIDKGWHSPTLLSWLFNENQCTCTYTWIHAVFSWKRGYRQMEQIQI
jgi:hypothetical protein